jgi:Concanavalin A-like lectin/glucanases superfamily/PEP-CTERM motif
MKRALFSVFSLLGVGLSISSAATIGYWRMDFDDDPGPGVNVPNEFFGGNPLLASAASLSNTTTFASPGVPADPIPQTSEPNAFGLNGDLDINGTVTSYPELNSASLTVEMWARTTEGTATLAGRGGTIDGFSISGTNNLQAIYFTDNGAGGGTQNILLFNLNLDIPWTHIAFTYDAGTGVASTYVDGNLTNSLDGPDGRALFWGPGTNPLAIGALTDGGGAPGGLAGSTDAIMDEVRLSDVALSPEQLLMNVPEPGAVGLLAIGGLCLVARRLRRRNAS